MRKLHEKAPEVLEDLLKRASREFATGQMDKETFDKFTAHIEGIKEIIDRQSNK